MAHERGRCKRDGLHRQQDELVDLVKRRPAGHAVRTEHIDIRLYEHVGKRRDRHLYGRRYADAEDFFEHFQMDAQIAQPQPDAGVAAHERDDDQQRGDALRDDRRERHAGNAHIEHDDEQQIEPGVDQRGDDKKIERAR